MSVSVSESFGRRFTSDVTGMETAVREYIAFCSTAYSDLDDVVADAITGGLPDLGDSYSGSSSDLIVFRHEPQEISMEKGVYRIQVQYRSNDFRYGFITSQPWKIQFYAIPNQYAPWVTTFDSTGFVTAPVQPIVANTKILNTAGEYFSDPPVSEIGVLGGIRLQKNFVSIGSIGSITTINELMDYNNAVNSDTPLTIAGISGTKYQFWMREIQASNETQNGLDYYNVTFDIVFDKNRHIQKILNAGWNEKTAAGKIRKITNPNGGDISSPWSLDINGKKVKDKITDSIYLGFGTKPTKDFSTLSLPTTF